MGAASQQYGAPPGSVSLSNGIKTINQGNQGVYNSQVREFYSMPTVQPPTTFPGGANNIRPIQRPFGRPPEIPSPQYFRPPEIPKPSTPNYNPVPAQPYLPAHLPPSYSPGGDANPMGIMPADWIPGLRPLYRYVPSQFSTRYGAYGQISALFKKEG
jgi:hypothetical protein